MNAKSYIQQLLLSVICRARRIPQFTAGLCIAWICSANSAHALNGFSSVNTCSQCTTTSQFETAAVLAAEAQAKSGVYTMVSTAGPMTAFMQVTGQLVFEYQAHKTVWVATTVVPVDASGNSLAGDTEAEQEAVYTSIDAVIMGTNRNNPEGWPLLFGPTSFGCAGSDCDAAVATAVLLSVPSSAISASKVGDTWTISCSGPQT